MAETIKLDDLVYEFTYKDKAFSLREATQGENMEYAEKFQDLDKDDARAQNDLMLGLLVRLGLPEELKSDLPARHMVTIVEKVLAQKKS